MQTGNLRIYLEERERSKMLHFIGVYDYTVILTYLSLFSAVTGMIYAARENFAIAILCVFISGFCDAFDGIVARSKKNRTEDEKAFGIQLDSLVDVVSFGVVPAFICYQMGVRGVIGLICVFAYSMCAVARLAFFNVQETKRQQVEGGSNKFYRGLPVTSISMIFPVVYLLRNLVSPAAFTVVLYIMLAVTGFLFIFDFQVKKLDFMKLFRRK